MKKFLILVLAALFLLPACGKQDDPDTPEDVNTTPVAAVMAYSFSVSSDMLATFDLTVEYYDADGKVHTESMTQAAWSKNVKSPLPATLGARLKVALKAGADVSSEETIKVDHGYSYKGSVVNERGEAMDAFQGGTNSSLSITRNKISAWLDNHSDGLVKFLYTFDRNGNHSEGKWN